MSAEYLLMNIATHAGLDAGAIFRIHLWQELSVVFGIRVAAVLNTRDLVGPSFHHTRISKEPWNAVLSISRIPTS